MELRAAEAARRVVGLATALLAVVAFRGLLVFSPQDPLLEETEHFLFLHTNTSPPIAVALALWLLVRRRGALRRQASEPGSPVLGMLLLLAGMLVFGWAIYVDVREALVFPLILTGFGVAAVGWGRSALRSLLVPAAVLLFAVPIPAPLYNELVFPLQRITTDYSAWLLEPLGIPAFVSTDRILLADKSFQVIEGCSGFRSIQTLTLVAILYVDLFYRHRLQAAILIGVAPILAFFLNGVRILTMMLNPYSEIVSVHAIQGVVVLLGGLGLLYALDLGLARWLAWPAPPIPEPPPRAGSSGLAPLTRPRFVLATGTLAVLCIASFGMPRWDSSALVEPALAGLLGGEVEGFQRELRLERDGAFFGKAGVSQAFHRRYRREGDFVEVFVGHWNGERPDVSPFSPKMAYPGSGWAVEDESETWLEPEPLRVETRQVRRWTARRLVYHWSVGRGSLATESLRSLLVLDRLPGRQRPGAFVVRLATNLDLEGGGRAAAEERLRAFARAVREGLKPFTEASSGREKHSPISALGFVGRPWRSLAQEGIILFESIG